MNTSELLAHADELYTQGRLVEALGAYESVVVHDSASARAYSRIGAIHAQIGEPELAERALTRALELDAGLAAAHSNLGNLYYSRGDYARAQALYQRALELDPANSLFHENLHAAYKRQGKYAEAVAALKQARRLAREEARNEARTKYAERRQPGLRKGGCFTTITIASLLVVFTSLYLVRLSI